MSLLLILFISLGAVSAADMGVNDMDSVDDTQNIEMVQGDLSQDAVELTSLKENPAPLRELKDEIANAKSGATIKLTKDYKMDSLDKTISFSKSLTIDGQGHTIDGSNSNRLFKISGNNVTYTPSANFNGVDTFTYTIKNMDGNTATATVYIVVKSINDAFSLKMRVFENNLNAGQTLLYIAIITVVFIVLIGIVYPKIYKRK